jgi:hypothetical protein
VALADELGNMQKALKLRMSRIGYLASRHDVLGGVKSVAPGACLANTGRPGVMLSMSLCGPHVATLGGHAVTTPTSASVIAERSICKARCRGH